MMLNTYKMKEAIEKIEAHLHNCEDKLWALQNLKRATKKDGKPFARLSDNYPEAKVIIDHHFDGTISNVALKGGFGKPTPYGRTYHDIPLYVQDGTWDVTFEEVEALIAKEIEKLAEWCESYRKQLKAAKKAFAKVDRLTRKLIDGINSIEEANNGRFRTSLGHALFEYAKSNLF